MSLIKTAKLEKKVSKTMRAGLKFVPTPDRTKKENILKAVEIIRSLEHESYKKLTPQRVDQAINFLRKYPNLSGVIGSAKLRKELKDCSNFRESTGMYQLRSDLLSLDNLTLILRGTSGTLAKALRSMPKDTALIEEILIQASVLIRKRVSAIPVNPAYTSQGLHVDCSKDILGIVKRTTKSWDIVWCSSCHQPVNSHTNAAKVICQRGVRLAYSPVRVLLK